MENSTQNDSMCSPEQEFQDYIQIETVFYHINKILPIVSLCALLTNLNFLVVVAIGIKKGKLPLKRYLMTINRSCADILTMIVAFSFYFHEQINKCKSHICFRPETSLFSTFMQAVFILNYWSVSLSYTGIALLTYYAVRSPLQYKVRLTARKVVKMICASWAAMVLLLVLSVFVVHSGELNYSSNSVIHLFLDDFSSDENMGEWLVDLCVDIGTHPPGRSFVVAMFPPLVFYFISVICYIFIIQSLFTRRKTQAYKRHRSAMWRLGIHLFLFSITCVLTGSAYYGSLPMSTFCKLHQVARMGDVNQPMCMSPVIMYTYNTAAAVFGWFTRMSVDGAIDTLTATFSHLTGTTGQQHKTSAISSHRSESIQLNSMLREPSSAIIRDMNQRRNRVIRNVTIMEQ